MFVVAVSMASRNSGERRAAAAGEHFGDPHAILPAEAVEFARKLQKGLVALVRTASRIGANNRFGFIQARLAPRQADFRSRSPKIRIIASTSQSC